MVTINSYDFLFSNFSAEYFKIEFSDIFKEMNFSMNINKEFLTIKSKFPLIGI